MTISFVKELYVLIPISFDQLSYAGFRQKNGGNSGDSILQHTYSQIVLYPIAVLIHWLLAMFGLVSATTSIDYVLDHF